MGLDELLGDLSNVLTTEHANVLVYKGKTNWEIHPSIVFRDEEGNFKGRLPDPEGTPHSLTIPVMDFNRYNPEKSGKLAEQLNIARLEIEDPTFAKIYSVGYLGQSFSRRMFCKGVGAGALAASTFIPALSIRETLQAGTERVAQVVDEWTDAAKYFTEFVKRMTPLTSSELQRNYSTLRDFLDEEPLTQKRRSFLEEPSSSMQAEFLERLHSYTSRGASFEQAKNKYEQALTNLGKILGKPLPKKALKLVNDVNENITLFGILTKHRREKKRKALLKDLVSDKQKQQKEWADFLEASRSYESRIGGTDEFYTRIVGSLSRNMTTAIDMLHSEEKKEQKDTKKIEGLYGLLNQYMSTFVTCDKMFASTQKVIEKVGSRYTAGEKTAITQVTQAYSLFLNEVEKQIAPLAKKEATFGILGLDQVGYVQQKVRDFFNSTTAKVLIAGSAGVIGWYLGGAAYGTYKNTQWFSQLGRSVGRKMGMNNPNPDQIEARKQQSDVLQIEGPQEKYKGEL